MCSPVALGSEVATDRTAMPRERTPMPSLVCDIPAALPVSPHSGEAQASPAKEDIARLHAKAKKLAAHLKAAVNDERTSDSTFADMQIDKHLNSTEKKILFTDHEKQWQSAQELAAQAAAAEKSAEALLVDIDRPVIPSVQNQTRGMLRGNQTRSISSNASAAPGGDRNATQSAAAALSLFAKFQEQVAAFSANREALEKSMKAKTALLMGLGWKLSRVIVADPPSTE
mmetsp:Transcript_68148/g.118583  ORF Transcript_68148/g.118583 Transcript_68148/m.118583 type:complete len:228 (-) Transcript_68148:29-712(-)